MIKQPGERRHDQPVRRGRPRRRRVYAVPDRDVGAGQTLEELLFWRMPEGGSQWNPFTPDHSSLSGDLVSFSVDGFSSYAVTVVPEPSRVALLAIGAIGLLARRRPRTR